jgi:uncharacterized protein GlcG (DUF336 family)
MRGTPARVVSILAVLAAGVVSCQSEAPPSLPPGGQCTASEAPPFSAQDLRDILARAVGEAQTKGLKATVAIVNRQGDFLAVYQMNGAPPFTTFDPALQPQAPLSGAPIPTYLAALSKAGTGAFLSSCGNAFSTRTASFIIQQHFPPTIDFQAGGPLFGVQFSSLPCSDVNQLPLGLSGDPGGLPLYIGGKLAGGIGVEINGLYGIDQDPGAEDAPDVLAEETIALAGTRGFEAPPEIRADQIVVGGIRFPYADAAMPANATSANLATSGGFVIPISGPGPNKLVSAIVPGKHVDDPDVDEQLDCPMTIQGEALVGRFPPVASAGLSTEDVMNILGQAACRAVTGRAAIRRPEGSFEQVNITVVDAQGRILGMFRTPDAPIFGADVSAQKARTAAFMSHALAGVRLRAAGLGHYVDALAAEDVEVGGAAGHLRLDGRIAFSDRGFGFLNRPFLPDGINNTKNGPFSLPIEQWSPLNDGIQIDLVAPTLARIISDFTLFGTSPLFGAGCRADLPALANGFQIFAGAVPLYRGETLVGAVGVSGDGIDQDDMVSLAGSIGFEAPLQRRSDAVVVVRPNDRRTRLPYVKLPRNPNLGE